MLLLWRAEVVPALDAKCELRVAVASRFPKIVLIVKFRSARGQKMSRYKCYLDGINETSTVCRAQTLRFQRGLRFPSKDSEKPPRVMLRSCGLLDPISCLYQILEWNSSTVHLETASSPLAPEF